MSDQLASYVRTIWPMLVGTVAGLLVAWLAKLAGIQIDSNLAFGATSAVMIAFVYGAGRLLETRHSPLARAAGRWILALGLKVGPPTYLRAPSRTTSLPVPGPLRRRLPPIE
jgi:hypothetical protein